MKKDIKKRIIKIAILTSIISIIGAFIWCINVKPSVADVGSFETYSSGSSSGYSSGSSWGSSSSSSGRSSSSSWSSSYDDDDDDISDILMLILFLFNPNIPIIVKIVVIAVIIAMALSVKKRKDKTKNTRQQFTQVRNNTVYNDVPDNSETIAHRIQIHDPNFNSDQFKSYVKDVFIKLQNAWTERDWEKIRVFESNELFEQHKAQLDGYIANNQINVMERICVNWVRVLSYEENGGKEILTVALNSRMGDYIIDATTKQVLRGDEHTEYTNTYTMQFIRSKGQLTPDGGQKINTTNCPNCGAPTKIMSSGRCEYCGSVITVTNHGWVLNNLERK